MNNLNEIVATVALKKATPPPPSPPRPQPRTTTYHLFRFKKERKQKKRGERKNKKNTVGCSDFFLIFFALLPSSFYSAILHLPGLRFVWNRTRLALAACILTTLGRLLFLPLLFRSSRRPFSEPTKKENPRLFPPVSFRNGH